MYNNNELKKEGKTINKLYMYPYTLKRLIGIKKKPREVEESVGAKHEGV